MLVQNSAVRTQGAGPVIESLKMDDFPEYFTSMENSVDGMVDKVSVTLRIHLWWET